MVEAAEGHCHCRCCYWSFKKREKIESQPKVSQSQVMHHSYAASKLNRKFCPLDRNHFCSSINRCQRQFQPFLLAILFASLDKKYVGTEGDSQLELDHTCQIMIELSELILKCQQSDLLDALAVIALQKKALHTDANQN